MNYSLFSITCCITGYFLLKTGVENSGMIVPENNSPDLGDRTGRDSF
jgi:hypothetical protein